MMRSHQHPQLPSICSTRLEHNASQKYLSKIDILIALMVKHRSWRRQWEMPVGGSALAVPGSHQSQGQCDEFAGLSLPAEQGSFSSQGQGDREWVHRQFPTPKVQPFSASANSPFWLGENILCSMWPPPVWASVLRRYLEIEEPVRTGWREWNNRTQDDSSRVSLCVLHAAYTYFIVRQITCVTKSIRK